ncbi:MAG TPA: ASPIC/UnbV domain-containing protein [Bacteroidales bacterium]|nr:ASPIC/UnbV domain-containing protein [Bacteroidales bacterium]
MQIYQNHVTKDNKWIDFELTGTKSNRSAIGAIIDLYYNNQVQSQVITGGIGFCSQNQRRLHFGLGKVKADSAVITWPGGRKQIISALPVNSLIKIVEPND